MAEGLSRSQIITVSAGGDGGSQNKGGGTSTTETATSITKETITSSAEFKHGYTYEEWMNLTPEEQANIETDIVNTRLTDLTSEENIGRLVASVLRNVKFLAVQTAESYTDDIKGVLPSDFAYKKFEKCLHFSPYHSWEEMVDDYCFNIFDVRGRASRTTSSYIEFAFEMWDGFYTWMKKNFGTWARVDEGWDGFTEGLGRGVGNIIGGAAGGIVDSFGGGKLLLIGGVALVGIILITRSKTPTATTGGN